MIAVIELKGKQFRVEPDGIIRTMRVPGEVGDTVAAERVLAVIDGDKLNLGHPEVEGAKVELEIIRQTKSPKLKVFKYRARKRYARRYGQRDEISYLKVRKIEG